VKANSKGRSAKMSKTDRVIRFLPKAEEIPIDAGPSYPCAYRHRALLTASSLLLSLCFAHGLAQSTSAPQVTSSLQTIQTASPEPRATTVYSKPGYFEAPNWTRDGASLIFDQDGRIMTVPASGGTPVPLEIGAATHCNGSHGLSPDGKLLAITCSMPDLPGSRVYLVSSAGGTPRMLTQNPNSYFHSWSPDGRTILFTRPDHSAINIMSIAVDGGTETPLTTGSGTSDDPDFAPDGLIYFNSDRGGPMQIWRMQPDGSHPQQVTSDDLVNWTPHVSPDGRSMVFVSYERGTTGHPANKPVALRLMSLPDRAVKVLVRFTGGSGSINVPSWAPDSHSLAFVSYQVVAAPGKIH
jgi:TolB protein